MEKPIKYKRFSSIYNSETLQTFFDTLVADGWEIIFYNELIQDNDRFLVTVVCSKKQSNVLSNVL